MRYIVPAKDALKHNVFRVKDVRYLHASEQYAATDIHGHTVMFVIRDGVVRPLGLEYEPNRYTKAQDGIAQFLKKG